MAMLSSFASMFAGSGGGGSQFGGPISSQGGDNRSINFNGPSGGASSELGMLLAYANGGPPANGGSFPNAGFEPSIMRGGGISMPIVLIGGAALLLVMFVAMKR